MVVGRGGASRQHQMREPADGRHVDGLFVDTRPHGIQGGEPLEQGMVGGQSAGDPLIQMMVGVDQAGREDAAAAVDADHVVAEPCDHRIVGSVPTAEMVVPSISTQPSRSSRRCASTVTIAHPAISVRVLTRATLRPAGYSSISVACRRWWSGHARTSPGPFVTLARTSHRPQGSRCGRFGLGIRGVVASALGIRGWTWFLRPRVATKHLDP